MTSTKLFFKAAIVGLILATLAVSSRADDGPFPRYPQIEPNIAFWTNIYTRYTTRQAVVHDSVNLDLVYGVIDLVPVEENGARTTNRRRMRDSRHHYEQILKKLAADPAASDPECRRVARLFGPHAGPRAFRHASWRVRCQIGQCDRFRAGVIRSGAYLDRIRSILSEHGVPEDLAYLPHVESSFTIGATSKSGAAGMWQFTRSTGRRFLSIDYVLDERRDPIAATHAAACLLKENFEKLGSWPLAITAYNHGAAGMQRAQARHGDYPAIVARYRSRSFKFASRNFYAEFLAARHVASDYRRYFGDLPLVAPLQIQSVELDGFVALADLCAYFDISPQVARTINPALSPAVLSGRKYLPRGYRFYLPAADGGNPAEVLAAIPAAMLKDSQRASRFYTVQAGDTASRIARMHRVKLADLIEANNLDHRATVYVRQKLHIPQHGTAAATAVPPAAPLDASPATHPAILAASIPISGNGRYYRHPGPSPAELLSAVDPLPATVTASVAPADASAGAAIAQVVQTAVQPVGVITVDVEETLGHYATWAGVSATRLRRLNGLLPGQPLRLNQEIKIPLDHVSADHFDARRRAFHKQLQRDFFAAHRIGALRHYRVQPGDSYWSLCREKFDLPLWLLRHYNAGVDLADLRVHQPLIIPAVVSIARSIDRRAMPDV
jgi:membrane-bound lytic murein transglycosylase D